MSLDTVLGFRNISKKDASRSVAANINSRKIIVLFCWQYRERIKTILGMVLGSRNIPVKNVSWNMPMKNVSRNILIQIFLEI